MFGDLRGRGLWVVLAGLVCQMGLGYHYVFGPLLTEVTGDLGWTYEQWSFAVGARFWSVGVGGAIAGWLVVWHGARGLLLASLGLLLLAAFGMGSARSVGQMLASSLVLGLFMSGVGDVVVGHAVAQWVREGRGTSLGIVYVGSNLGGFALIGLTGWLLETGSWRQAFWISGIVTALVLLPAALVMRRPEAGEGAPDATPVEDGDADTDLDLGAAARSATFWILGFMLAVWLGFGVVVIDHAIAHMVDQGWERDAAATWWRFVVFMGIAGKLAFGMLADRMPAKRAMLILMALYTAGSVTLLLPFGPAAMLGFILTYGLSYAARDVIVPLMVIDSFGVRYMGRIYGVLLLTLMLAPLASIAAGRVHDASGSYGPVLGVFAVLNLVSLALLTRVRRIRA